MHLYYLLISQDEEEKEKDPRKVHGLPTEVPKFIFHNTRDTHAYTPSLVYQTRRLLWFPCSPGTTCIVQRK